MVRVFLLLLALCGFCQAQVIGNERVSSRISHSQVGLDETATFTITVKGLNDVVDVPTPTFRPNQGLQVVSIGRQFSMSSVNGVTQTSTDFNFLVTPLEKGRYIFDPITVNVNGVDHSTQSHRLEVTDAVGFSRQPRPNPWNPYTRGGLSAQAQQQLNNRLTRTRRPRGADVLLEAELEPEEVYVHEPAVYKLRLLAAVNLMRDPQYNPISPTGFVAVRMPQTADEETRNGRRYAVTEARTAFFPVTEGDYTFPISEILLSTGFFGNTKRLATQPKQLKVLPLPKEGQPTSFTGAVGEWFDMQATVNKTIVKAGQTVELRVEVEGEGHLDLVPYPYLPNWEGVEKKQADGGSSIEIDDNGIKGRRTYLFRLKFKEPGTYDLNNVAFAYFRPSRKHYETLKAPKLSVTVTPSEKLEDEANPTADGLPEKDRPASEPDAATPAQLHLGLNSFLMTAGVVGLSFLIGLFGSKPQSSGGGFLSAWKSRGRPKDLDQLEAALRQLAPGHDSVSRESELSTKGWNDASIRRFEAILRDVFSRRFSGQSSNESVDALIDDFLKLKKEGNQ